MKIIFFLLLYVPFFMRAQPKVDSLRNELFAAKEDTAKALILFSLSQYYSYYQPDSAFFYAQRVVHLSQQLNFKYGEALGFFCISSALDREGNYPKALEMALQSLRLAEQLKSGKQYPLSLAYFQIGLLYRLIGDDQKGIINLRKAVHYGEQYGSHHPYLFHFYAHLGAVYEKINLLDSAFFYAQKGYNPASVNKQALPFPLLILGRIYKKKGDLKKAKEYLRKSIYYGEVYNSAFFKTIAEDNLARLFQQEGAVDSCIIYAKNALQSSLKNRYQLYAMTTSSLLMQVYESRNNKDSTLKYMKMALVIKDTIFNQAKMQQFQLIAFDEQQRQQKLKATEEKYENQVRIYALLTALAVFLFIAVMLYRNNRQKHKAKSKIEKAYEELKNTQAQLIQREKMASLGELTAGIAHEIQNPLNFVNNFSEVNKELIEEMKEEINKGNIEEVKALADDIEENEQKINHHGKRADAIVKGMLQHSRTSTKQKELTDINALADEYLRLSYHGFRAKDKSFNATIETHFDESIGKINVVPQDIGRVLLNLFNNAFYAVTQRKEVLTLKGENYEPTVWVSTKRSISFVEGCGEVIISVRDNGSGIPQKAVDKIFQPFFTTKPTGQGTGLGLSISYDIITKVHSGQIKVETKEGEFAEFIISLPIN